ncbi:hypothetical protein ML401_35020 (plasmid) [Bradyrhizobium sp. 62B]|uniref:hypothetical protein n=1 Tax=Bradyrhizobium sp. 62B TaxID=2898442 RepID=UPI0025581583|nr:hypothetical protein ML401_35020 [Bradyrhizobium sp. 62B]
MRDYLKVLFTSVALVGIGISLGRAEEELPSHKTIANRQHVEALGCEEESKTFTVDVPDPERLDRSYRGVMDGIELRLTESKNGCVGNFSFKNDHQITFSASAKGAGHWGNLNLFGRKGPRYCVGGAGGAITLDLIAHYK